MTVMAVSGVNVNKAYRNNVSFGHNNEDLEMSSNKEPQRANNFVKVPVMVMMALSPSLLSGAGIPEELQEDMNAPRTELMAAPPVIKKTRSSAVRREITQYAKPFSIDGKSYTMYYTDDEKERNSNPATKNIFVLDIYIVPAGYKPIAREDYDDDDNAPPRVEGLRLHKLNGKGKDYYGALVSEMVCREDGSDSEYIQYEIKIPDDIANAMLDLAQKRTKFKLNPYLAQDIINIQVTNDPKTKKRPAYPNY